MTDTASLLPHPDVERRGPTGLDGLVRRAIVCSSARLRRTLRQPTADHRRHAALDRWFAGFAAEVRGHLDLLETGVLPRLSARGAIDDRDLDAVAADHLWIDHLLGELGDALGVLGFGLGEPAPWQARAAAVADELDLVLAGVMAREGRTLVPMTRWHLTAGELEDLERSRRRDLVVHRAPFALAWLCDTLGAEAEAEIMASVPGPARLFHRARRRAYARTAAALTG